jgi:hypothetical protein
MTDGPKRKQRPYPVFVDGDVLTDDTLLKGIPVKHWDAAFTANFEKSLEWGKEIMRRLDEVEPRNTN